MPIIVITTINEEIKMGEATEYLKGKEAQKSIMLKYLKKRRDSMMLSIKKEFDETQEINNPMLESYFVYNAIVSDIKNNRLD